MITNEQVYERAMRLGIEGRCYPHEEIWDRTTKALAEEAKRPKKSMVGKAFDTRTSTAAYIREAYNAPNAVVEFFDVRNKQQGPGLNVIINGVYAGWAKDDYK